MSKILVVAEHFEGKLKSATVATVGFAKKAAAAGGGEVVGLVLGSGAQSVAAEFARYGVSAVYYADAPFYANYLAEAYAPAVAAVAKNVGATLIAAAATTTGRDYLPRVAALVEGGMVSDVVDVFSHDGSLAYRRPMWAGNLIAKVVSDAEMTCVSVRTTAFEPAAAGDAAPIEALTLGLAAPDGSQFVSFDQVKSNRPELTDAKSIIAGGRGLKSAEAFKMLEEFADLLGGAVGASRAAVDSGYAPNDWQIGQTGKIVAPQLYVAVAISGAIQHLAGMKGSKVIVAINKDAEAPIFQVSDYGLVADAFKAVPELVAKVKSTR